MEAEYAALNKNVCQILGPFKMGHFEMGNKTKVGQSDRIELIFECYIL